MADDIIYNFLFFILKLIPLWKLVQDMDRVKNSCVVFMINERIKVDHSGKTVSIVEVFALGIARALTHWMDAET
jgi:hypothetical protein